LVFSDLLYGINIKMRIMQLTKMTGAEKTS